MGYHGLLFELHYFPDYRLVRNLQKGTNQRQRKGANLQRVSSFSYLNGNLIYII
jgi:hypothetical protein